MLREAVICSLIVLFFTALPIPAAAQKQPSDEDLVKQTQNPVADLISVPLQNNFNFGTGSKNRTVYVGNIQPVIPSQAQRRVERDHAHDHADHQSAVALPRNWQRHRAWRHQPDFLFLTGKARRIDLGRGTDVHFTHGDGFRDWQRQVQLGPGGSRADDAGTWVFGALANNQWSVAGWGKQNVNSFLLQPFVNYNLPDHWYLVSAPIMTANWAAAKGGDVWTVPLGGGFGKLFRLGDVLPLEGHALAKLPINTQLQAFGNVAKPDFGSDWQLRFQVQLLFPK